MKQEAWGLAGLVAALTLAGCGSATDGGSDSGGESDKLVVWDWKSGDDAAAAYVEQAKARLRRAAPGRDRRVRGTAVRPVLHATYSSPYW